MRRAIKSAFLISALSPMLLILGVSEIVKEGVSADPIMCLVLFVLFSALGWLILLGSDKLGESLQIRLKKIKPNDSFLIPFIVSSIPGALKMCNVSQLPIQATLLGIFVLGMIISYIPIHPVLRIFGYRFYESETEAGLVVTIIAKRDVRNKDSIKSVVRISENLFIERTGS